MNPDMCTNQSRHTVSFSDLAWEKTAPRFPKAWMVGRYLERYVSVYGSEWDLRLGVRVVWSERGEKGGWRVVVKGRGVEGSEEELEFDYLLVASGFFGKAKLPLGLERATVPVLHSSKFRDVKSLLTDGGTKPVAKGRKIVIVGGQMSGVETAAAIAMQISSATNTPGEKEIEDAGSYVVTHLVQKPVWVMPLFFPGDPVVEVEGEKVCFPAISEFSVLKF